MPGTQGVWYGRTPTGSTVGLTAFTSPEFPDGHVVDTPGVEPGRLDGAVELWRAEYDPATRLLTWADPMAGSPVLWFVASAEPSADPPAQTIVAFATDDLPAGRVIGDEGFAAVGRSESEQVGAIRWWSASGQIHQIYVQPQWRRQGIGTALLHVASAQQVALGTGTRLWAGGERTDLGETLAEAKPYGHRVAKRTAVVAPMTPADKAVGIPDRLLRPDDKG